MANAGNLGKVMSQANNWVSVYTAPTTIAYSSITLINFANNDTVAPATITLSVGTSSPSGILDIVTPPFTIDPNFTERDTTLRLLSPGEHIYIYCTSSLVSIRVEGIEAATL